VGVRAEDLPLPPELEAIVGGEPAGPTYVPTAEEWLAAQEQRRAQAGAGAPRYDLSLRIPSPVVAEAGYNAGYSREDILAAKKRSADILEVPGLEERLRRIHGSQQIGSFWRGMQRLLAGVQPWVNLLEQAEYGGQRALRGERVLYPEEHVAPLRPRTVADFYKQTFTVPFLGNIAHSLRMLAELYVHSGSGPGVVPEGDVAREVVEIATHSLNAGGMAIPRNIAREVKSSWLWSKVSGKPVDPGNAPIYLTSGEVLRAHNPGWGSERLIGTPEDTQSDLSFQPAVKGLLEHVPILNRIDNATLFGFVGDIAMDPTTYVGGEIVKGVGAAAKVPLSFTWRMGEEFLPGALGRLMEESRLTTNALGALLRGSPELFRVVAKTDEATGKITAEYAHPLGRWLSEREGAWAVKLLKARMKAAGWAHLASSEEGRAAIQRLLDMKDKSRTISLGLNSDLIKGLMDVRNVARADLQDNLLPAFGGNWKKLGDWLYDVAPNVERPRLGLHRVRARMGREPWYAVDAVLHNLVNAQDLSETLLRTHLDEVSNRITEALADRLTAEGAAARAVGGRASAGATTQAGLDIAAAHAAHDLMHAEEEAQFLSGQFRTGHATEAEMLAARARAAELRVRVSQARAAKAAGIVPADAVPEAEVAAAVTGETPMPQGMPLGWPTAESVTPMRQAQLALAIEPRMTQWLTDISKELGPEATQELVAARFRADFLPDLMEHRDRLWTDSLERLFEVHGAEGKKLAAVIDRLKAPHAAVSQRMADLAASMGKIDRVTADLLAPIHTYRALRYWFDPNGMIDMAFSSDPIHGAELLRMLNEKGNRGLFRGPAGMMGAAAAGAKPWVERENLGMVTWRAVEGLPGKSQTLARPEEVVQITAADVADRLGRMGYMQSQGIQADMWSRMAGRESLLKQVAGAFGKTREEAAAYILEGVPEDLLKSKYAGLDKVDLVKALEELSPFGRDRTGWAVWLSERFGAAQANQIMDRLNTHFWNSAIMPDSPHYGLLADKWLPPEIAAVMTTASGTPSPNWFIRLVSKWKYNKAIFNTAAMVRNAISNHVLIMNQLGFNFNPAHYAAALKDMAEAWATEEVTQRGGERAYGPMADWARAILERAPEPARYCRIADRWTTLRQETFVHQDVAGMRGSRAMIDRNLGLGTEVGRIYHQIVGAFGKAYQFEEELGKMAVFRATYPETKLLFAREGIPKAILERIPEAGLVDEATKLEAAAAIHSADVANKCLFNYRRVPPVINQLRGWGIIPFITFPYKALPATFHVALEHPGRLATWSKMMEYLQDLNVRRDQMEAAEPEWMRTGGYLMLPDALGKGKSLNLTYLLPWGSMVDQSSIFLARRNPGALKSALLVNIPLVTWISEAVTGREFTTNRQMWDTEKEPPDRVRQKMIARAYTNLAPVFLFGSSPSANILASIRSGNVPGPLKPLAEHYSRWLEKTAVVRELSMPTTEQASLGTAVLGGWFGLRTRPFDTSKEVARRYQEIEDALEASNSRVKRAGKLVGQGRLTFEGFRDVVEEERRYQHDYLRNHAYLRYVRFNYYGPGHEEEAPGG